MENKKYAYTGGWMLCCGAEVKTLQHIYNHDNIN